MTDAEALATIKRANEHAGTAARLYRQAAEALAAGDLHTAAARHESADSYRFLNATARDVIRAERHIRAGR